MPDSNKYKEYKGTSGVREGVDAKIVVLPAEREPEVPKRDRANARHRAGLVAAAALARRTGRPLRTHDHVVVAVQATEQNSIFEHKPDTYSYDVNTLAQK